MKFTPKTDKEILEENLVPVGAYDFEIFRAEEKTSKNGNEMIELGLKIFKEDGTFIMITDYLLESMSKKLKSAADACQLLAKYDIGNLAGEDFMHKCGKVKIDIEKDKTGKYADKNVVSSYVKRSDAPISDFQKSQQEKAAIDENLNDDIPF